MPFDLNSMRKSLIKNKMSLTHIAKEADGNQILLFSIDSIILEIAILHDLIDVCQKRIKINISEEGLKQIQKKERESLEKIKEDIDVPIKELINLFPRKFSGKVRMTALALRQNYLESLHELENLISLGPESSPKCR